MTTVCGPSAGPDSIQRSDSIQAPGPSQVTMLDIRLFAAAREIAGTAELRLEANSVAGLCEQLVERFGADLERLLPVCSLLIDGRVVRIRDHADLALSPEATIDILPPFAGG